MSENEQMQTHEHIIVTRHTGLVEWLQRHGITGKVIPYVDNIDEIKGKHIVGVLPLSLAAYADTVTTVDMEFTPDKRGVDISADEMDLYKPTLNTYKVTKL